MGRVKDLEHGFKDWFFRATGMMLQSREPGRCPLDAGKMRKVLFLRPDKLGDMAISFPVFDALKARYPHLQVGVLGSPRNAAITVGDPRFDQVYMYTKRAPHDLPEIQRIRREGYDCVVDMVYGDSLTTLYLSEYVARGKPRIGVGKKKYAQYYDYNRESKGQILEATLRVVRAFGIEPSEVSGYAAPWVSEADQERAGAFVRTVRGEGESRLVVGYNLSAGAPTRLWQLEKSVELLRRILAEYPNVRVVLIVIPKERDRAEGLMREVNGSRVHVVPDGLNLRQASAVIGRLDLLITPDTSLVHIARSFRVPVVGLYSGHERNFRQWRPFGQDVGAVVAADEDNIFDITVDQVMTAFVQVVSERIGVEE